MPEVTTMQLTTFATLKGVTVNTVRIAIRAGFLDVQRVTNPGSHGPRMQIKWNHKAKTWKVGKNSTSKTNKKSAAWDYRRDLMGSHCLTPSYTNLGARR
jgi:hypothetical protein